MWEKVWEKVWASVAFVATEVHKRLRSPRNFAKKEEKRNSAVIGHPGIEPAASALEDYRSSAGTLNQMSQAVTKCPLCCFILLLIKTVVEGRLL